MMEYFKVDGERMRLTRKLDKLGRIVIPKNIRSEMGIEANDKLMLDYKNGVVIISIHEDCVCDRCGRATLSKYKFCPDCGKKIVR